MAPVAGADVEKVKREVEEVVGIDCSNAILTSAKQGIGIEDVLEAVVKRIPPPPDNTHKPLRALIFDSYYDAYKAMLQVLWPWSFGLTWPLSWISIMARHLQKESLW